MICSDKWVVQLVVDQCKARNISHWVFSPGSRNAPFAITVDSDPYFHTTVIHDERSAAFFALGMAERLNQPVVLCCTSGSAPANYLPAITEAYYRNIPLLVVSADRPQAWTDQGDGQTIRQLNLFKDFTHSVVHLEDGPLRDHTLWQQQRETAILFDKLQYYGPAHINVGLSEPLYQTASKERTFERTISVLENFSPSKEAIYTIAREIEGKKVMVLCGQLSEDLALLQALEIFASNSNVVVLTENTSNLWCERFNACIDRSLNRIDKTNEEDFMPEVLISLGGAVVSKRIKSFLRKSSLHMHIRLGISFPAMDTYQQLSHSLVCEPTTFFQALNKQLSNIASVNFSGKWKQLDYEIKDRMPSFLPKIEVLTDFHVYQVFFELVPEGTTIHMANSSVIRYCQLFDPIKGCHYFANRGTSGIDGSTSTALGYASKDQGLNILLTGDVSFLYDSNALRLRDLAPNLKIILINNQGGGIFRIIDGSKDAEQRSRFFEASHELKGTIAQEYGWKYRQCQAVGNLDDAMHALLYTENVNCLEIRTDANQSPHTLKDFFNFVQ
ncbi:MAG: 2-succinyl-5-enolpyruvyl-6-hydroxy-3-cyclohexene-carboxylic-acid synthase [Bacteroidota bacterium]|jgi:2-succinyl-5-enolpyruvyl-6-hydroxy-3-cyclohexene-1-carboxylate synthase